MKKLLSVSLIVAAGASQAASKVPEKRSFPLSKKVKPCDNFYDYVCSEVVDNFKMPADKSKYVFSFSDSYERLLEKKKSFMKELSTKKSLSLREVCK